MSEKYSQNNNVNVRHETSEWKCACLATNQNCTQKSGNGLQISMSVFLFDMLTGVQLSFLFSGYLPWFLPASYSTSSFALYVHLHIIGYCRFLEISDHQCYRTGYSVFVSETIGQPHLSILRGEKQQQGSFYSPLLGCCYIFVGKLLCVTQPITSE